MLEILVKIIITVIDIVLYVPRRIALHFESCNANKEKIKKQKEIIREYEKRLYAIRRECDISKTINWCGNISIPMNKIKELASPENLTSSNQKITF